MKRDAASDNALRQAILARAVTEEGARFSPEGRLESSGVKLGKHLAQRWVWLRPSLSFAAVVIVLVGIGLIAKSRIHSRSALSPSVAIAVKQTSNAATAVLTVPASKHAKPEPSAAEKELTTELAVAKQERALLEERLDQAERRASHFEQVSSTRSDEVGNLRRELETARANQVKTEEELARLRSTDGTNQVVLVAQEQENRDLRQKVEEQSASLDRERQLMSLGREIRDLVAARNLHIIDVYDTSGEGHTQKSFGRVFYTEGKSLVFYAYDLPARHPVEKYAFYAWGKRDVSGQVKVRNLGIFYNDDQTQKRWVLKIDDPRVLAEIDSVFVTLEKTDGFNNKPNGKQLLSAYLSSPANHP